MITKLNTEDKKKQIQMISIEELVPQDHLLRKIDQYIQTAANPRGTVNKDKIEEELVKIDGIGEVMAAGNREYDYSINAYTGKKIITQL